VEATVPDFEISVVAPAGKTTVTCVRGCQFAVSQVKDGVTTHGFLGRLPSSRLSQRVVALDHRTSIRACVQNAPEAVHETRDVEVDEERLPQFEEFEVRQRLGDVNGQESGDGLDLDRQRTRIAILSMYCAAQDRNLYNPD
jgi:hypothetical protein